MDFIKALTFITEDPRWKEKVVIGAALALFAPLIVPALVLLGYALRLMQNMRDGKRTPLPEWDDWSGDLVRGFKLAIVYLIWSLPAATAGVPLFFGSIMADSDGFVRTFGVMVLVGTTCLTFLYGIFVTLMTPGFVLWFARDEQIQSGLQLSEIFAWTRQHLIEVVLFLIAVLIANFIFFMAASVIGTLLCLVGLVLTIPLATFATYMYQFNLLGQIAYKDRTGELYYPPLGAPTPSTESAGIDPSI
ncbi:MAG: DUF4013 domain-containing protein [Caldilinea sp.]|nr:DUF4013 domain-containing protein [Caldilinea sp.]MDW8441620.1 DUF4013 domain-containing protein [Caldilineaceae bacterium]